MLSVAPMKANIPIFSFSKQTLSCGFLFSNLPQGGTPSLIAKSEIQYQQQHRLIIQFNSWRTEAFTFSRNGSSSHAFLCAG
jgi:hypothetical protein